MSLRPKDAQISILHQKWSVVNGQDAFMPKAEKRGPTIVPVAAQIPLTIRIPVGDDSRGPVCDAILCEELLQYLVCCWRKTSFVFTILMTLPSDVPTLIIFQVIRSRGKIASSSIARFPLSVLQNFIVDGRVICKLSFDLNVPPPSGCVLDRVFYHAGTVGGSNTIGISSHILGQILMHAPRSWNFSVLLQGFKSAFHRKNMKKRHRFKKKWNTCQMIMRWHVRSDSQTSTPYICRSPFATIWLQTARNARGQWQLEPCRGLPFANGWLAAGLGTPEAHQYTANCLYPLLPPLIHLETSSHRNHKEKLVNFKDFFPEEKHVLVALGGILSKKAFCRKVVLIKLSHLTPAAFLEATPISRRYLKVPLGGPLVDLNKCCKCRKKQASVYNCMCMYIYIYIYKNKK